jgi:hypothetical protein
MKKYVLCVTTLIALATAVPAQAALMDFSLNPAPSATPSYTGSTLDTSTAFNLGALTAVVGTVAGSDTTGAVSGETVTFSTAAFTYGSGTGVTSPISLTKTFAGTGGTYTETLSLVEVTSRATANQINLELFGVLNGPAGSGFVNTPAGLLLSATQAGGTTGCNGGPCAVSWSGTELSNPPGNPTPLPAALPLFASGLGALGLLGWRKKRKNAAAIAAA